MLIVFCHFLLVIDRVICMQHQDEIRGQKVTQKPSAQQSFAIQRKKHRARRCFFTGSVALSINDNPAHA